jgi:hypothetical protein
VSDFDSLWNDFEQQAGPILVESLTNAAPVSDDENDPAPGTLAASMEWRDQDGVLTAGSSDPRGPIATYVTKGTQGFYDITPVSASALHFFVGGEEVFTQHVSHPGIAANPFHIRAWEDQREAVVAQFRDTVGHGAVLSYLNPNKYATLGEE